MLSPDIIELNGHNSILAMVAVGPEYEILCTNVGMNGRMSDGGNWIRNKFKGLLEDKNNPLNLPPPRPLPGRSRAMPYVAVGDDAFPLSSYMLKSCPSSSLTACTHARTHTYIVGRSGVDVATGHPELSERSSMIESEMPLRITDSSSL